MLYTPQLSFANHYLNYNIGFNVGKKNLEEIIGFLSTSILNLNVIPRTQFHPCTDISYHMSECTRIRKFILKLKLWIPHKNKKIKRILHVLTSSWVIFILSLGLWWISIFFHDIIISSPMCEAQWSYVLHTPNFVLFTH